MPLECTVDSPLPVAPPPAAALPALDAALAPALLECRRWVAEPVFVVPVVPVEPDVPDVPPAAVALCRLDLAWSPAEAPAAPVPVVWGVPAEEPATCAVATAGWPAEPATAGWPAEPARAE